MEFKQYKAALEAMLFAFGEPVSSEHLAQVLEIETEVVDGLLKTIGDELCESDRGLVLLKLENKWQLSTKSEYGDYIKKVLDTRRNTPLSAAAMEVLAIIAYNQPVSRSFIEQVRGVDSSHIVRSLLEKSLIAEAGRLNLPGKPVSFCTTDNFLRTFGISSLAQLPPLHDEDEEQGTLEAAVNAEGEGEQNVDVIFPDLAQVANAQQMAELEDVLTSTNSEENEADKLL